jgi:ribulose-phosphate 3-epimerase
MSPALIAPSILSADFTRLGEEIHEAEAAGADWIHVDVMDGHFVPNLTMGPFIVEACRRVTSLPLDVHLMVSNPGSLLEAFASAGADHLTVHVETCPDLEGILARIHTLGCKAGVTLNPATTVDALEPALSLVDLVLVMTVHPGYSGQAFKAEMLAKIRQVRGRLDELGITAWLEVDGGVAEDNIAVLKDAGADVFVAAKAIFLHSQGIHAGVRSLRRALVSGTTGG